MKRASEHILISLESRHAENILHGRKSVELRRRTMRIEPGTTVWIYSKQPVGSIVGRATVARVEAGSPARLWRDFKDACAITRDEFLGYFGDSLEGCAVVLELPKRLRHPVGLTSLRKAAHDFHPPQFFQRLDETHPILATVSAMP